MRLRRAGMPLPSVVQSELSPLEHDVRISRGSGGVEGLVRYCMHHGITLMSHSPVKAALRDERSVRLADTVGVSVPQLMLRYLLQRGFVVVFGSKRPEHVRANMDAIDGFQLNGSVMSRMACWRASKMAPKRGRGTPDCATLLGGVGRQVGGVARQLAALDEALASEAPNAVHRLGGMDGSACVRVGENDPIVSPHADPLLVSELRATPRLHPPAPGMAALPDVWALRVPHPTASEPMRGCPLPMTPIRCRFRLAVVSARSYGQREGSNVRASTPAAGRLDGPTGAGGATPRFAPTFAALADDLATQTRALFDAAPATRVRQRHAQAQRGLGAQHVLSLVEPASLPTLRQLEKGHLLPYLERHVFGAPVELGAPKVPGPAVIWPGVTPRLGLTPCLNVPCLGSLYFACGPSQVSRNEHIPGERSRRRSMLWHWDSFAPETVKVILYLNNVDHTNGCMVVLQVERLPNQALRPARLHLSSILT